MSAPVAAVLLDVDGTLYHQGRLRALMAGELGVSPATLGPAGALRLLRILRSFRHEREHLRGAGSGTVLNDAQYSRPAEVVGVPEAEVRAAVEEWIYRRPLKYLGWVGRRGQRDVLRALVTRGLRVGVFSDYPTSQKVEALGLADTVSVQVCATDPDVNAFKPHPAGFLEACRRWGLPPDHVVYVGDRPDVDATGAAAAGMRPFVIGARTSDGFTGLRSFGELERLLVLTP